MKSKLSQSSFEYLTILSIAFGIVILIGGIFIIYSDEARAGFDYEQINSISSELIDNIHQIYFLGKGNRFLMNTKFPSGIENLTLHQVSASGKEFSYFNFTIVTSDGFVINEIVIPQEIYVRVYCKPGDCGSTPVVNGSWAEFYSYEDYSKGAKKISIESAGDRVYVGFVD